MVEGRDAELVRRAGRRARGPRGGASKLARPGAAARVAQETRTQCAGSSATPDRARRRPSSSRACAPRVPRLRLGRHRARRRPAATCSSRSAPASSPTSGPRSRDRTPHAAHRPRPHALGDPRPAERPQRPSPPGLHAATSRSSTTASSRTSASCATGSRRAATGSRSETDTEALAHLIEEAYAGDLADAVRAALRQVHGAYAIAVMHRGEPDRLVGARMNVPLIVGLGDGRELPRLRRRRDPRPHRPGRSSSRRATSPTSGRRVVTITGLDGAPRRAPRAPTIDWSLEAAEKGGYEHFMLKEMHEQPEALRRRSPAGCHRRPDPSSTSWSRSRATSSRTVDRVELVACGTAYYASLVGAAAIQDWAGLPGPRDRRLRVPLQPAAARRADARHRGHPVGRDGRHDRPDPPRPRARAARSSRSPTPSARRSPARRTRCSSSRPARRSRSRPPRRS